MQVGTHLLLAALAGTYQAVLLTDAPFVLSQAALHVTALWQLLVVVAELAILAGALALLVLLLLMGPQC